MSSLRGEHFLANGAKLCENLQLKLRLLPPAEQHKQIATKAGQQRNLRCFLALEPFVRMWPESVRSFDERHQPLRQFAFHYVFIHQPQDSLWHNRSTLKAV